MTVSVEALPKIKPFTFKAHDPHTGSPNRMHKDELTQKLGFRGGFVVGTNNYAQMVRGIASHFGPAWLDRCISDMRFLKPVVEGDVLTVTTEPIPERVYENAYLLQAHNEEGVEVVRVEIRQPEPFPEPDPLSHRAPSNWEGEPQRVTWEALEVDKPFRAGHVKRSKEENRRWAIELGDDVPLYREGESPPLHPALLMRCFAQGVIKQFIFDNVQISKKVTYHKTLRVGHDIEVLTVPIEKFEKRGNYWGVFYDAAKVDGEVYVEEFRYTIFKMRGT